MKKNLSRFDMHCYSLYEAWLSERVASAEITADTETSIPKNPLQDIQISFNGLRPMPLQKFINDYARKDEEANLILSKLMTLFEEDLAAGRIPGAKGKQDFPKWLIARFGDDNPTADILIYNPGDENMRFATDEEESKKLTARWHELGFSIDFDDLLKDLPQ
jgi:hypothetical protein